ncbi:MAG: UDP-N-acetylmuramoyl-tripeptide--D-alanyl-D-alanine ligase [Candidatus Kerfeldbacteria bacterium]|nr:UDP-N-acetylmuramoyl-tripeptide--D-alanyl-D-alanine ligase [Candidatus Kerfeldbacteria bacterium]
MKRLLQFVLKCLARATLAKYHPRIVGITGSVGKTSTKEAVAAVLARSFRVGQAPKNLNNELGLPLAILGEYDSGYRNVLTWISILGRASKRLIRLDSTYPKILVLEYGVDHPGDMDYLLSVAQPDVGLVTAVGPTHLEFMGSIEAVAKEKAKLVTSLPAAGLAVLNVDDEWVSSLRQSIQAPVVTFGLSAQAQVRAEGVGLSYDVNSRLKGVSFKLISGGSSVPIMLAGVAGRPPVLVALAAAAVGVSSGISPLDIAQTLQAMRWTPGRLRLLAGVKHTTLIDDSYNSSPKALAEALEVLAGVELASGQRRWAVLGDMLELGAESENLHQQAGALAAQLSMDYLVMVGERSRGFARGAMSVGFNPDRIWHFAESYEAGRFVQDRLEEGDVVLIKGSQGVRCEKITKELMAEPQRAKELLVRQYKPWV